MPISDWSEDIIIAEPGDGPTFSEDMDSLMTRIESPKALLQDVIVDMKSVSYMNSTNIAQFLRLRKGILASNRRLRICAVCDPVWSVLMITGLDKIFDFTDDVSTALASLQFET